MGHNIQQHLAYIIAIQLIPFFHWQTGYTLANGITDINRWGTFFLG